MYLPSMFFGGSSFIHLLASNPRVVALFGVGALVTSLLQTPFGTADVAGTAGYVERLEAVARQQGQVDPQTIEDARSAAMALAQSPKGRLNAIVEETLLDCGATCLAMETSRVVQNPVLLHDVLFLHSLMEVNRVRVAARAAAGNNGNGGPSQY